MHPPAVVDDRLVFHHHDPDHGLRQVQLACDDDIVAATRFRHAAGGWTLSVPTPDVLRLEYRLLITDSEGQSHVMLDPTNPLRVSTAFGNRSVVELPGYDQPDWLTSPTVAAHTKQRTVATAVGDVPVTLWTPAPLDASTPAPLLVVHDGPEYVALAGLGHWAAAMVATQRLPTFRMALVQPVHRNEWYAAHPAWPSAVATIVDAVTRDWAVCDPLALMGASLGGLAALQSALAAPTIACHQVAGVFAQSGSFFQPTLDPQEADYPHFDRITSWTARVGGGHDTKPLRITLTCGRHEENHANNVAMRDLLRARGHHIELQTVNDLHNFTAWRDALDPGLTSLLTTLWHDGDDTEPTHPLAVEDTKD